MSYNRMQWRRSPRAAYRRRDTGRVATKWETRHGTWCVAVVDTWDDDDRRRSLSISGSQLSPLTEPSLAQGRSVR